MTGTTRQLSTSSQGQTRRAERAFRECEILERRTLFAAQLVPPPPDPIPLVADAEFNFETAPHSLRFRFNTDVSDKLDTSDLVLLNDRTRQVITGDMISLQYDKSSNTAVFQFDGLPNHILPDAKWQATLLAEGILPEEETGGAGTGTIENSNFVFLFSFLTGDADQSGTVDLIDMNILAGNFGLKDRTYSQGDLNYDGLVNLMDFNILVGQFGASLDQYDPTGSAGTGSPFCGEPIRIISFGTKFEMTGQEFETL